MTGRLILRIYPEGCPLPVFSAVLHAINATSPGATVANNQDGGYAVYEKEETDERVD